MHLKIVWTNTYPATRDAMIPNVDLNHFKLLFFSKHFPCHQIRSQIVSKRPPAHAAPTTGRGSLVLSVTMR